MPTRGESTSSSSSCARVSTPVSGVAIGDASPIATLQLVLRLWGTIPCQLSIEREPAGSDWCSAPRGDVAAQLHAIEGDHPGRSIRASRARRSASGPSAVTFSTRPPAVTSCPVRRSAVPACVTSTSPATWSRPVIGSPLEEQCGIAGAGQHHRDRPLRRRSSSCSALRRSARRGRIAPAAAPAGRRCRRGSTAWVSGSPKRTLNSSTRGPAGGQHHPGVQHTVKRRAPLAHQIDDRLVHERARGLRSCSSRPASRRVGAHAAGVRSLHRRRRCACSRARRPSAAPSSPSHSASSDSSSPRQALLDDRARAAAGAGKRERPRRSRPARLGPGGRRRPRSPPCRPPGRRP